MSETLLRHPIKHKAKKVARLRARDHLTWSSLARQLIEDEIDTHPYFRKAEDLAHPDYDSLVRSYAGAAETIYRNLCEYGYETPPPADTTFHSPDALGGAKKNPKLISERLDALTAELNAAESGSLEQELLEMRVTSEKQRLRNLRSRAAKRVRSGRPFMDGKEAAAVLPPLGYMEGVKRVKQPYPPISDLELLGQTRYDHLIAERVAEARQKPGVTQQELYFAAEPHMLPLATDLWQPPKSQMAGDLWVVPAASSEEIATCQHYGKCVVSTLLAASIVWDVGAGRRPLHEPRLVDLTDALIELSGDGALKPCSELFGKHLNFLDRDVVVKSLHNQVQYLRRKYGMNKPVTPSMKPRLEHLQLFTNTVAGPSVKPDDATLLSWEDLPNSRDVKLAWRKEAAAKWATSAWKCVTEFYEYRPTYSL